MGFGKNHRPCSSVEILPNSFDDLPFDYRLHSSLYKLFDRWISWYKSRSRHYKTSLHSSINDSAQSTIIYRIHATKAIILIMIKVVDRNLVIIVQIPNLIVIIVGTHFITGRIVFVVIMIMNRSIIRNGMRGGWLTNIVVMAII